MGLVGSYHHYIFKAKFHTKDCRAPLVERLDDIICELEEQIAKFESFLDSIT